MPNIMNMNWNNKNMKYNFEYKGFVSMVEYSYEDKLYYGKVENIKDLVTFQSESLNKIEKEFWLAVDDYLAFCEDNNI